ncbi:hypothetical protein FRX31_008318 [Thalictrum thalictroides]|uniref:Transmembrane protein n=1 Tax=Thalictrum thalictroides TaxID=46969 RepID=A0A7J6WYV6_THATH|nr:hypothetical protein FRX31_008318 [Thalictrum thalictroides]
MISANFNHLCISANPKPRVKKIWATGYRVDAAQSIYKSQSLIFTTASYVDGTMFSQLLVLTAERSSYSSGSDCSYYVQECFKFQQFWVACLLIYFLLFIPGIILNRFRVTQKLETLVIIHNNYSTTYGLMGSKQQLG